MKVLITGGAGYIGSIAVEMLLIHNYEVTVLDDFSSKSRMKNKYVKFIKGSILDRDILKAALSDCDAVLHFAGKSIVSESVLKPDYYHSINYGGTKALLEEMKNSNVNFLVFSSSAAVYGQPIKMPISEKVIGKPTNPYGKVKLETDNLISREVRNSSLSAVSLRYFNVAGSFYVDNRWLNENHKPETHLIPNILKSSRYKPVNIFGNKWPTVDGTCIRDYVHVVDLVNAHILALKYILDKRSFHEVFNIGSGTGHSVRNVIDTASEVLNRRIHSKVLDARVGDPAVLVSDITKAAENLKWRPERNILDIFMDFKYQ